MRRALASLILLFCCAQPAHAQEREVPYWATIRPSATKLHMRAGPSVNFPISWIYQRPGLPMKVVRVHESWRLVRDPSGTQGWVASRLLSPERGAIVTTGRPVPMRDGPSDGSTLKWFVEAGVVGGLGDCMGAWCEFSVAKRHGWVPRARLWGSEEP
ncbi:SH3 domain-containing protein [Qipengyuania sp.]|uniref:SH3 domain-containing protein n=1 Tax=Qipengyuania sp. TaxID=2004515 RepID=UPI0035C7BB69